MVEDDFLPQNIKVFEAHSLKPSGFLIATFHSFIDSFTPQIVSEVIEHNNENHENRVNDEKQATPKKVTKEPKEATKSTSKPRSKSPAPSTASKRRQSLKVKKEDRLSSEIETPGTIICVGLFLSDHDVIIFFIIPLSLTP